ncbi:MAG: septum formation initiator family protein [Firmicutes bacterium]|nr:septum formation initiator family protein [Bacillota bacterium]
MERDILTESILSDKTTEEQRLRREKRKEEIEKKRENERKAAEAAARRSKALKKYAAVALVFLVLMIALFGKLVVQIKELNAAKAEALDKLGELQQQIEELEATLETVSSPEYIESQARSQLHMIYPNEVLYVVEDGE